jgi:hypothetical protein
MLVFVFKNRVTVYLPKKCASNVGSYFYNTLACQKCSFSIRPKYFLFRKHLKKVLCSQIESEDMGWSPHFVICK